MKQNIEKLRKLFKSRMVDCYVIPSYDEYQNEYTPESSRRLEFITGFTGSNGLAIVTKDQAYFFTDGRYLLQSKGELGEGWEIHDLKLLPELAVAEHVIGYNPMLFTENQLSFYFNKLQLKPLEEDLVDLIWDDKPPAPASEAYLYPLKYAGLDATSKLELVRKEFLDRAEYCLITSPASICWVLNIRASDIECSPIMLGYMLISKEEVILFTNLSRINVQVKKELSFVEFHAEHKLKQSLAEISGKIMIDPGNCSEGLQKLIKNPVKAPNPCSIPQSCKNDVEIKGAIAGHIKDAVALCEALAWIVANKAKGLTEYDISLKLTHFRSLQDGYIMDSFHPIVGFRENGAIIHYRADNGKSKVVEGDGVLLIDSGGHYLGCTTDVTRTIVLGKPEPEVKKRYTQVLKGHIRLAAQIFPVGTFGCNLDVLARMHLWQEGLDYAHGTGHGVGNALNVHEGPTSIRQNKAEVSLKEGMIASNEPGFYKDGHYGMRIENLVYIKKSHPGFLEFQNLTLVPYCRALIDFPMLDKCELDYLKSYYLVILEKIAPLLSNDARQWLEEECVT